jgi:uncharacterized protein YrrD
MGAQVYPTPENGREAGMENEREILHRGKDLKGKAIVDIQRGEKVGSISDLLFDPGELRVAAIESESGAMFNRETEYFQAEQVEVWGKDVILVRRRGDRSSSLPGRERLVNLSDQLNGRPIVSSDGVRVGQLGDVLLNQEGRLTGFELSQVDIQGPLEKSRRVPISAVQSLGKDVVIIDTSKL